MTTSHGDPTQLIRQVTTDGVGLWPGFINGRQLDQLRARTNELASGNSALHFPTSTRVWDLYRHGEIFLELLTSPALDELLTTLLGENYLLSDFSINVVNPHQPIDDWHIDYPYNEMPHLVTGATLGLQCILALDPFTADNGATQYIPHSHQPPRRPSQAGDASAAQDLNAEPGTLLVMAASTWHRSGYNASNQARAGILLSYVVCWVRPMAEPPEPGPWSATKRMRLLLGQERPPETINGVPISCPGPVS